MTSYKVRIYDLAKELKMESKRIMEEVRREGVDVSVPSNTISKELAEKIRNKYFPKKEPTVQRAVRVVKKAKPVETDEAAHADDTTEHAEAHAPAVDEAHAAAPDTDAAHAPQPPAHAESPSTGAATGGAVRPLVPRLIKKEPAARAERPEGAPGTAEAPAPETETHMTAAPEAAAEADVPQQPPTPLIQPQQNVEFSAATLSPEAGEASTGATPPTAEAPGANAPLPGRQVRVLRPTATALAGGLQPGQRVTAPAPPPSAPPAARDRGGRAGRDERGGRGRGREDFNAAPRGTPGETATPQTVYTPPTDARRPGGRPGRRPVGRPGHGRGVETRGGRFDRDFIPPPKALTREERIAQSLNIPTGGDGGELKPVRLVEGSTVKEFAEKLGIKPKDVVALLMQRGVLATINQPLNAEVASDIGRRFGFDVSFVDFEEMVAEEEFEEIIGEGIEDYVEEARAPVVTVMGHVDHGKTSLLDGIRTTDVAGGEAGGITQHIGAYSVQVKSPDDPTQLRRVVFLDTPGHEAFTMMRARGAKATDVVVLVVAADDGVMPQTVEAIEHARAAGVPIVVAINKIDRPDANPDRVRQELAGHGLQPVEWGGETEMVPVSAKKRENLDTLLETILLTADILNLRASPSRLASGVVLEAKLDRGRGSVATVLVQQGTLRVHDPFIVGQIFGKVRAMFNDRGEQIQEAGPATPVEVLGLQGVPQAGETFQVVADITKAQQISHHRQMVTRQNTLLQTTKRGIEALGAKEVKELLIIVKADVQGSVEVLKSTLQKLSTDVVKVRVIRSGAGAITESDVLLAAATQTEAAGRAVVIIGFNVRPEVRAAELAKQEHVDIRLHSIIYKVEEEIRAAMIGMLEAVEKERITGTALVQEVFRVPRVGAVAGCRVTDGTIRRNSRARLIRDGVVAWEGNIGSLRRFKDDVSEVREGFECGIGLENFNDIKENDQIEAYVIDKIAATEL
ncbi:MAG TPA: translation initiation factor IF-2 [Pyrinomonadaceae bacterium]|nr:translation initiation factor IF-2 [Pyrinomonadaceae bacterium]